MQGFDYSSPGAYFLTVNTQGRQPLFGEIRAGEMTWNDYGKHVTATWQDLPNHYQGVMMDEFVVMPDHFHSIVVIDSVQCVEPDGEVDMLEVLRRRRMTISRLVGRFKMTTSKWINERRGTPGARVWQRNYHDHIVRDAMEHDRIRAYIAGNPRRWWETHKEPITPHP
ncbi:MAG TPA: transposase [Fibrobacteria bacterium]|nr:transposase [Fibrobacteria bacterium]HOX50710.1 transposase [Fibrobacteria bacterium]